MSDHLYLGVDGGQSSTTALIADITGRVLGRGSDGPCNHVQSAAEGREKFIRVIGGCIRQAARHAGLTGNADALPHFRAACLGFSGGPDDKEGILRELLQADHLRVTTDALIALTGATAGGPGIITIAGTGSISFGSSGDGHVVRAGGWGYMFGDEGAGFDIARQATRAALRQHEGWGPQTSLHDRLLATTGAADANQMLHWFYTADWPRKRVAALSLLVDEEAEAGDRVALDILYHMAAELSTITNAVRAQLFAPEQRARIHPIGSVWKSRILRSEFAAHLSANPANTFLEPLHGPAAGALLEAFRLDGRSVKLQNLPESEK